MRFHFGWILMTVVIAVTSAADATKPITFTKTDVGKLPSGWASAKTGEGEGNRWEVIADDTSPSKSGFALAQLAKGPTRLFNVCVADSYSFKDGEIGVRCKAVSGEIDQGGGLVWRYKDSNNYYVCRYNPLEENFRVYTVKDGKRHSSRPKRTWRYQPASGTRYRSSMPAKRLPVRWKEWLI